MISGLPRADREEVGRLSDEGVLSEGGSCVESEDAEGSDSFGG